MLGFWANDDSCDYYWEVQHFDRQCGEIVDALKATGDPRAMGNDHFFAKELSEILIYRADHGQAFGLYNLGMCYLKGK
jgi:hypothetical protein